MPGSTTVLVERLQVKEPPPEMLQSTLSPIKVALAKPITDKTNPAKAPIVTLH